jgi:hypothetical protein
MEYWGDGITGRMFVLFFVILYCIPQSAIYTPQSKRGGGLMLWIMNGPEKGTIQSSKFKVNLTR